MLKSIFHYYHTIRHLKVLQIVWRLVLVVLKKIPVSSYVEQPIKTRIWNTKYITKNTSFEQWKFTFLNESYRFPDEVFWSSKDVSKLWIYNLHYFDYINQNEIDDKTGFQLIDNWIKNNPPGISVGWEPYPLSLRIVNWIKFLTNTQINDNKLEEIHYSLYLQSRHLYRFIEYHILGNHLIKNAVALLYAGEYFQSDEAEKWKRKGLKILRQQVAEQILSDGGHFERSPMYHVIVLEDLLDCINLINACGGRPGNDHGLLERTAQSMLDFLLGILHQDGELPMFNDCAFGIAPGVADIEDYAEFLGLGTDYAFTKGYQESNRLGVLENSDFGLYVLHNRCSKMIVDAGPIGPDYLPGHAHCDTLSFELSVKGRRCIVNSGTYQYAGNRRNEFRATKAHNTVRIDGSEQHEIWSTFRVARRGYPFGVQIHCNGEQIQFSAAHSGYRRLSGEPVHTREILGSEECWKIVDRIEGSGAHCVESFIHLHPDIELEEATETQITCRSASVKFRILAEQNSVFVIQQGFYSAQFGIDKTNRIIMIRKTQECPISIAYRIETGL